MWVARREWDIMKMELDDCKRQIALLKENTKKEILQTAKKIIQQPEKMLDEVESAEKMEEFINKFLES